MEEIRKEPVTVALILINVLIFIAVELTGTSQDAWHVLNYGAAYTPYIVEKGEVYRLFTSMFLHFGIEHLVNNMLVLFVLGSRLEQVIGKIRLCLSIFWAELREIFSRWFWNCGLRNFLYQQGHPEQCLL